jgi:predicted amidohydrolase
MRRCVVRGVVLDVSKGRSAFIFRVKQSKEKGDVFGTVSVTFSFVRDELAEPPFCHVNLRRQTVQAHELTFQNVFDTIKGFE